MLPDIPNNNKDI